SKGGPVSETVVAVDALEVTLQAEGGVVRPVSNLSLAIAPGEVVALVGESGCGKTTTALAIMGLLPSNGRITGGDIRFEGRSLARLSEAGYRSLRGGQVAMIFQDPLSSLHPSFRVGEQIAESLLVHRTSRTKREARERAVGLLDSVGL